MSDPVFDRIMAGILAGSAAGSPLLFATPNNYLPTGSATGTGTKLSLVGRFPQVLGVGNRKSLAVRIPNYWIDAGGLHLISNPIPIQKLFLTRAADNSYQQLTYGGSASWTIANDIPRHYVTDLALPAAFGQSTFVGNERYEATALCSLAGSSATYPNMVVSPNDGYFWGAVYDSASFNYTDAQLRTSGQLPYNGSLSSAYQLSMQIVGQFDGVAHGVPGGFGDSIEAGYAGDQPSVMTGGYGYFNRALFPVDGSGANPMAGCTLGVGFSTAALWADPVAGPALLDWAQYCSFFFSKYGTNNYNDPTAVSQAQYIIAKLRALKPGTTIGWGSLLCDTDEGNTTPSSGAGPGGALAAYNAAMAALVGAPSGPDVFINMRNAVVADTTPGAAGNSLWGTGMGGGSPYGKHPSDQGMAALAGPGGVRAFLQAHA